MRERREHARGRILADCGRICGSPDKSVGSTENVEEIFQMINNVDSKSYIGKTILWKKCLEDSDILQNVESIM